MASRAAGSEIETVLRFVGTTESQGLGSSNHGAETASGRAQSDGQRDIRQYFQPVASERRKGDIRAYFRPVAAAPTRTQNLGSGAGARGPRDLQDRTVDGKPSEKLLAENLEHLELNGQTHGPKSSSRIGAHGRWVEEYRGRGNNAATTRATVETPLSGNALESKVAHGFGSAEARTAPDTVLQPRALLTVPNIDCLKTSSFSFRTDAGKTPTEPPAYNQTRSSVLPGFDPAFEVVGGELPATPLSPHITDVIDHTLVPPPLESKRPHSPSTISDLRLRIINAALEQDAKNSNRQLPATPRIRAREEKKKRRIKQNPNPLAQWQKYREENFGSSVAGSVRPGIPPNSLKPLPQSDRPISMPITPILRIHSPRGPCPMPSIDHTLRSHSDRDVCMIVPCIRILLLKRSSSLINL